LIVTAADLANLSLLGPAVKRWLERATVVSSDAIPPDVVTMNSQVILAYESTGVRRRVTLVYPQDANSALERISVLHPLGTALLAARPGQRLPGGLRLEHIVYQPEHNLRRHLVLGEQQ
jgi:regulator of nucleoside diphosphate kinase